MYNFFNRTNYHNKIYKVFYNTHIPNQIIINGSYPNCKDCIYFKQNINTDNTIDYNKSTCLKFGNKNLINGDITYEYAKDIRISNKCGPTGLNFLKFEDYNKFP